MTTPRYRRHLDEAQRAIQAAGAETSLGRYEDALRLMGEAADAMKSYMLEVDRLKQQDVSDPCVEWIDEERRIRELAELIERQISQGAENVARHIVQCWEDLGR